MNKQRLEQSRSAFQVMVETFYKENQILDPGEMPVVYVDVVRSHHVKVVVRERG